MLASIPLLSMVFALGALLLQSATWPGASLEAATVCGTDATRTVYADVVALDQTAGAPRAVFDLSQDRKLAGAE